MQGFPGFHWAGDGGHGGVQFSLGIGVFPISFFASFFNTGFGTDRRPEARKRLFTLATRSYVFFSLPG